MGLTSLFFCYNIDITLLIATLCPASFQKDVEWCLSEKVHPFVLALGNISPQSEQTTSSWDSQTYLGLQKWKVFCKIALLNLVTSEKVNSLVILDTFDMWKWEKWRVLAKQKIKVLLENMVSKDNHENKKCQLSIWFCHRCVVRVLWSVYQTAAGLAGRESGPSTTDMSLF